MGGVVARLGGFGKEIRVAIFELEILDPPGAPEGFDFSFGKLHRVVRQKCLGERIGCGRDVERGFSPLLLLLVIVLLIDPIRL